MEIYNYNPITKEFTTVGEATRNPVNPDNPIVPACATTIKPLNKKDGYAIVWCGNQWNYKKDYRGQIWYNSKTKEMETIDFIGDLPDYYYSPDSTIANPPDGDYWVYDKKTDTWIGNVYLYKQYIYSNSTNFWEQKLNTPYEFEKYYYLPQWRDLYTSIYLALNTGAKDEYKLQDAKNQYITVDKKTMKPIYVKMADIVDQMYIDKHDLEELFMTENNFDVLKNSFDKWLNKRY